MLNFQLVVLVLERATKPSIYFGGENKQTNKETKKTPNTGKKYVLFLLLGYYYYFGDLYISKIC